MPTAKTKDDEYYSLLAFAMLSPEGLPEDMNEALYAIHNLSTPEGQQSIERAIAQHHLPIPIKPDSTHGEIAMQLWLAAPEVLARLHNQQRLVRLPTFRHFCARAPAPPGPLTPPEPALLQRLEQHCDQWFAAHSRGRHTTCIEAYPINGELWFLIRHGDTFTRAQKVEQRKTSSLHFRPPRDDVAVYSHVRNELRIHAGTVGERDLYRAAFGLHLFSRADYFSEISAYTFQPLFELGEEALDTAGVPGLDRVRLRELDLAIPGAVSSTPTLRSDDLFALARSRGKASPIPPTARVQRAAFDLYFTGSKEPRKVQLRAPNTLRLACHSDLDTVEAWFARVGFRTHLNAPPETSLAE